MTRRANAYQASIWRVFALVAALLVAGPVAANDVPPTDEAKDAPARDAVTKDFDALVKKGDQARIAGKWSSALEAYAKALELRDDPLVAGRVGLVLVAFHKYEAAAGNLVDAIERGAGVDDGERARFFQAFLVAQKNTCRVDVIIVQTGVKLEVDGKTRFAGRREGWMYVKPGRRTVHASLEGFEDETMEIDAPKGGQLSIKIELRPVKPKEEPAISADSVSLVATGETPASQDNPTPVLVEDKPPSLTNPDRKNGSFVVGLGGGFLFGATPTPAVGPHAFVAWRSGSWWEVGVDARVAWTFVPDERFPTTRFVTWSVGAAPCGRLKDRWFSCALIQLDGMKVERKTRVALQPGFGLRGGVEFVLHERVHMQVWAEAVVRPAGFDSQGETSRWNGFPVTGGFGTRATYTF
jgi:hypothetical protein